MQNKKVFITIMFFIIICLSGCRNKLSLEELEKTEKQTIKVVENNNVEDVSGEQQIQENVKEQEKVYYNTYDINMEVNPENGIIEGFEKVTYKNTTGKVLRNIYFHIYAEAFEKDSTQKPYTEEFSKEIFKSGQDYSKFTIKAVYVNNKEIKFSERETILALELENELKENEETEITIQFEGYIPKIAHRMGSNENAMWVANFLPVICKYDEYGWRTEPYYSVGEPFYSDISNYNAVIITPKGYSVAGTGTQSFTEDLEKRTTILNAKFVRDFAFVVSNKYNVMTYKTDNNIKVNFWYYSDTLKKGIDVVTETKEILDYYGNLFGSYPYEELDLVEVDLFSSEIQSYPTFIMLDTDSIKSSSFREELALGIGKQWIGNIIGVDCINTAWLKEGLASYLQKKWTYFQNNEKFSLVKEYNNVNIDGNISDTIRKYETWEDYYSVQRDKAGVFFYILNQKMGDEKFEEFLKACYKNFAFKTMSKENFIETAEKFSEQDLDKFFKEWLETKEFLWLQ